MWYWAHAGIVRPLLLHLGGGGSYHPGRSTAYRPPQHATARRRMHKKGNAPSLSSRTTTASSPSPNWAVVQDGMVTLNFHPVGGAAMPG